MKATQSSALKHEVTLRFDPIEPHRDTRRTLSPASRRSRTPRPSELPVTQHLLGPRRLPKDPQTPELPFAGWTRFSAVELIGQGGMGRVYKAFDPILERSVALKFPRRSEPGRGGRTLYEAKLQARVSSQHVPQVFEVGELDGEPFFAMQLIEGESLKAARHRLPLADRFLVAERLCEALQEIHDSGLVHRDVNPRNIILQRRSDGTPWPFVIDFGITHELPYPSRPIDPQIVGTAPYMAPEQVLGNLYQTDRRTDLYSLGATLYELFSGERPFADVSSEAMIARSLQETAMPLTEMRPELPEQLGAIVARCLEKDPADRFPSARSLAVELADCRSRTV